MQIETKYQKFKREIPRILGEGHMDIREIYDRIRSIFPSDCDNSELCEHGGVFYQYGEWKHLVRDALQGLKREGVVRYDPHIRKWERR